jgi:phosphate transport system protein
MAKHFHRELEKIKKNILSLGAMVEERVQMAIKAIENRDAVVAEQIIRSDHEINEMEMEVEEDCLKVLALHQPVAIDLRFLIAIIKINNDLERIGDQMVNVAQRVVTLSKHQSPDFNFEYSAMGEKAATMLKMSLDCLVNLDNDVAFKVLVMDDVVDAMQKAAYDEFKRAILANPEQVSPLTNIYLVSRHLERMADHATNIAEEVVYLIEGEIVRHGGY